VTSTSVILGTAAYLSPEQVLGQATGPRSDVYAAGIMAFELLTGTTPFSGDSAIGVANQRLDRDVPPPSSLIDGVPEEFDAFIAGATARDPDLRFADAAAMGADLDTIAEELALPQFRVPAPKVSAQRAATVVSPPVGRPTRQLTRAAQDWQPVTDSDGDAETELVHSDDVDESDFPPRQFAGIDIDEFIWSRQRSRRVLTFWVLTVFVLTGLVALAGWTLGTNLNGLLGR
jgi:serine/threonine-protein kinase